MSNRRIMGEQPRALECLALLALLGLGCGAMNLGGPSSADAGSNNSDAGTVSQCDLGLVSPAQASLGQEVEVGVEVVPANLFGVRSFQWRIDVDGVEQVLTELADPLERVSFVPTRAGPYQIVVDATIGGLQCTPATGMITVTANGALSQDYRMRVVPPSGAPTQDFPVTIYGGADSALPTAQLEGGQLATGQITQSDGTGVAAYLRARKRGTLVQTDYEGFSDSAGAFSLRLPSGSYDLLIVPSDGLLPARLLEDVSATSLGATIVLPAPQPLSGHVFSAGGAPVQGALVSLVIDGAPTTSALSGADGSFSVLGGSGQLSGLTVAPLAGSGMPALRADALTGQAVDGASDVIIRYAIAALTVDVDLTLAAGGPAVGALVEWRSDVASAATVHVGTIEGVAGTLRVTATADGSGHVQSSLAALTADLVVHSADATQAVVVPDLNWASVPSTALSLSELVSVPVSVTFSDLAAVGASVLATPLDVLAPQGAAQGAVVADSGLVALPLVRGGTYEIVATDTLRGTQVQTLMSADTGMPTQAMTLTGTILASGSVFIDGAAAAGAQLSLYCESCSGDEATRVHARAVANGTGRYVLRVADPGVAAP